jgi:peptidoglycan/xylan/chitin deacetylase (PgdA/CDA1 family)
LLAISSRKANVKLVSPFLKSVVYPSLSATGFFRRNSTRGLAIVTYHGVLPQGYEAVDSALDGNLVSADTLHRQLRMLKMDYNVISPDDMLAWLRGRFELPPRAVLLTCDDGLLNNLTDMLQVLQQEKLRCLFFVTGASTDETRSTLWYEELFLLFLSAPTGKFEISGEGIAIRGDLAAPEARRAIWWSSVMRLSQIDAKARDSFLGAARRELGSDPMKSVREGNTVACRRFGLLTLPELRALLAAGMTIGAHTLTHPMLSQLRPEIAGAEIVESRTKLEAALQTQIWAFAYPFGDAASVTPQIVSFAREAGYEAAFLNYGGGLGVDLPLFALPRVHVTSQTSLAELEAHVSGFYAGLQRRAGRASPVFETHQV